MVKKFRHLTLFTVLFVAACVTVNIYFPAAAIQKAADEIVDDISGDTQEKQKPEKKQDIKSRLFDDFRAISFGPNEAHAQLDVNVSTPAIRNIRQTMKETFRQLKPFYESGVVGNNNKGFVEIRSTSGLNLKEKADVARLVEQQNKGRSALYAEIVKENKLDPGMLSEVQKLFANSWRNKSKPGWWIQNDKGEWEKKQ